MKCFDSLSGSGHIMLGFCPLSSQFYKMFKSLYSDDFSINRSIHVH